jgi:hypothetical protein
MMAAGERNLGALLADLSPELHVERYTFEPAPELTLAPDMFALVREAEGVTGIRVKANGEWARISLGVHSSLDAVGLTAALSQVLAGAGISANVVAALHHDHVFVPWDHREDALRALRSLA